MAKEFVFPTMTVRGWAILEQTIRDGLHHQQAAPAMETRIVARMKEHYDALVGAYVEKPGRSVSLSLLAGSTDETEAARAAIQNIIDETTAYWNTVADDLVDTALGRFMRLELELYEAGNQ